MKKLFKILILFAMVLTLFACNKKNDAAKTNKIEKTEETTASAMKLTEMPIDKFDFQTMEIMDGKIIKSEEFYKDKPITLVNIWGTFCGPCKEEMPDLAKLYEKYKDKVNFLGVVVDTNVSMDTNVEEAQKIIKDSGVNYTNIMPSPTMEDNLVNISAIPTTFFVNSEGKILGGFVGKADKDSLAATIEKVIAENK
ncbi:MAG: TlpA family protein disulfide reductase [Peptoniphilus sp.]|uniref:TlpA family protein disulfide reductase n=1 Tax=Peptoniphilus sp. TaxID=1971214 RepID=UPI0025CC1756|nr:TlpA disulfide reductase family protein [Peptoniphilus sp.]MCI5643030.1 TlpA family protein disulfide reductase [Peptoniphilus sp.]MDD7353029.1 TlpA disulfide reductase family protein [Peptoniphilaceae bacterium]